MQSHTSAVRAAWDTKLLLQQYLQSLSPFPQDCDGIQVLRVLNSNLHLTSSFLTRMLQICSNSAELFNWCYAGILSSNFGLFQQKRIRKMHTALLRFQFWVVLSRRDPPCICAANFAEAPLKNYENKICLPEIEEIKVQIWCMTG